MVESKSGKIPIKRDPKKILEEAGPDMIRRLLNDNSTIGDLSIPEMKKLLGLGTKTKLPDIKDYNETQI